MAANENISSRIKAAVESQKARLEQFEKDSRQDNPDLPKIMAISADETRRRNASSILWIYGGVLAVAALIFIFQGFQSSDWKAAAANILELIKIGVMPVITLVIGYYFGKSE